MGINENQWKSSKINENPWFLLIFCGNAWSSSRIARPAGLRQPSLMSKRMSQHATVVSTTTQCIVQPISGSTPPPGRQQASCKKTVTEITIKKKQNYIVLFFLILIFHVLFFPGMPVDE